MKTIFITLLFLASIFSGYSQSTALLIFGCGEDNRSHKVYLGCLNCSEYDQNSIWNQYGTYGSKYSANSIWNEYGTYGNSYSSKSPFNSYADCLPAVVDESGNFYGYLTPQMILKYKP